MIPTLEIKERARESGGATIHDRAGLCTELAPVNASPGKHGIQGGNLHPESVYRRLPVFR